MGKLGKKARKFAKKNLPSVLRDRRKKKALFKKRYSSKNVQSNVEDQAKLIDHSNERNTEVEAFEDLPLEAPFIENDCDGVVDSSDSDGYLSEDISYDNETESEPGKLLEGDKCTSELMMQNIKIQENLAVQTRKLERLKWKDPSFSKFLEKHKDIEAVQNGVVFSDEDEMSNHGRDSVTEDNQGKNKGRVLTVSAISSWCRLIKEEHKEEAFVCLLNAYRAACHYGAESIGLRFQNAETFCSLVMSVLSEADNILRGLLGLSSSSYKKEAVLELKDTPQWVNVKPLIKSYLRSTLSLLDQVTDSEILAFALTRLRDSLPFFAAFPYLLQRLIKTTIHLWATGGGMLSSASFSIVLDMASLFTTDCFDNCLAKAFVAYLAQSRATDIVNNKHLQFLRNSLVDLCSLDVQKSLSKATVSVRQLAKVLQWGLRTKKKEALQRICSWEYANCINLWVGFIARNEQDYDLQAFFFTMVQLINGVVRLFPGPRYFPLRLNCIQWLNDLSNSTGVFIPITSFVLDVLEYKTVGGRGKPGPTLFFQSVLKLPKSCLKSQTFQDECITSAIEQLSSHFLQWSYHISFPELATVPLIRLKKFNESKTKESLCRAVKHLIEQVEKNVDSVQKRRNEVAFSPNDHQSVETFLQFEKSSLSSPFSQYYRSVLDKAALRGSHKNEKISLPRRDKSKRKRDDSLINVSGHKDLDTVNGTKKRVKRRAPKA
ncbi:nucleolar complex-associated protein 2 [Solanum stenotomum]|uniref:nucleolar complex-associated protein 2 n=1 Tax=Solanum stenotomum TaxID=172797 RepID=UPI0020D18535|nr:nucleolar complex-associated protein 2 [Solanum stenotomum]